MSEIYLPPEIKKNLVILGIMGGICAGKSTVAKMFEELGVIRMDADQIANQCLQESSVQTQILDLFGNSIIENGQIQRKKIARIVFSQPESLKKLEKIIHPIVCQNIQENLYKLGKNNKNFAILDVPLLWESGWYKICDYLIFVDATSEIRQFRAASQRNWSKNEISNREKFQADILQKKSACQYVVPNHGNIDETRAAVQSIWKNIVEK